MNSQSNPSDLSGGKRILGLDFGKYLLNSNKRRVEMESDNTTGTESDLSDWEVGRRGLMSENSEDSDEYGIYYGHGQSHIPHMFDTAVDSASQHRLDTRPGDDAVADRQNSRQMRQIITQLNSSHADSAYSGSGSLYAIHETGSILTETDSSGSYEYNSDGTCSNSGSPVHNPVYGRYQKLPNQIEGTIEVTQEDADESLDTLMLHRLPGENLGMILGIEGGKDGSGKVSSVSVKSVTLGGAAYRATGSSKGVCVGDEIIQVNTTDLRTLTHDECISVFKDMPLRVLLGIRRGEKDLPAVSITPLPVEQRETKFNYKNGNQSQQRPLKITRRRDASDSEDESFGGFAIYQLTIEKEPEENLGLSIVPSYGSTKEYYQIKRILPSGAAAHSGHLQVGDRLVSCNGTSLRALTQNHCLKIIKTASSRGDVNFEIIRPVYDGSSMEISVTLNNNNNAQIPSFDPLQYSLKSQSYDRHVDVIVTSESEDYLTVSEDEYSRTGRLADIPEVEANEVFSTNSVKLAFQKPFNTIEEESTETETEPETTNVDYNVVRAKDNEEIVDLNKINTSPYHIPHKNDNRANDFSSYLITSTSSKNQANHKSVTTVSDSSSFSEIDTQRVPKTDIDTLSCNPSVINSRQYVPNTDLDTVSVSTISPRSPIPNTDLDNISVNSAYSKRQQVPTDNSGNISPPFNYPSESVGHDNLTSDIDSVRYNPLYEDGSFSEFTDSEPVNDVYIASPDDTPRNQSVPSSDLGRISVTSNRNTQQTELDRVSVDSYSELENEENANDADIGELGLALPPPVEFSDNQNNFENDSDTGEESETEADLPVTNIDDIVSDTYSAGEVSPSHHDIEIVQIQKLPQRHVLELETSFQDLENATSDKPDDFPELEESDSNLAFTSELTAPFDSVLQEQANSVHKTLNVPVEFADSNDSEILQIVQSYDDGTIVISQIEPSHKRESTDSPTYFDRDPAPFDNTMDPNSEDMLKDALDMEYENLPESSKYESRINLGEHLKSDENNVDLDDPNFVNQNIAAECIANEILKNEGGGFGYYMESDDEPDEYPDQDNPEDLPELPDAPPPVLMKLSNGVGRVSDNTTDSEHEIVTSTNGLEVKLVSTKNQNVKSEVPNANSVESDRVLVDSNWSFRTKDSDKDHKRHSESEPEIVPLTKQRKVEIPIDYMHEKSRNFEDDASDVIVPVKVERKLELPPTFSEKVPEQIPAPNQEIIVEPERVVVTMATKKTPPPVAPKPARKPVKATINGGENEPEPVVEEVITATEVKKDHAKSLVNVISVVNALKAGAKDKDPDVVDKIVKEDKLRNSLLTVINMNAGKSTVIETSPPRQEVIVTEKEEICVKKDREMSPPKQEVIVTEKDAIHKAVLKITVPDSRPVPKARKKEQNSVNEVREEAKKPVHEERKKEQSPVMDVREVNTPVHEERTKEQIPVTEVTKKADTPVHKERTLPDPTSEITNPMSNVPVMKTSISVEKPKVNTNKPVTGGDSKAADKIVPSLNLNTISSSKTDSLSPRSDNSDEAVTTSSSKTNSVSPRSDKSDKAAPTSSYKTKIGVKPAEPEKPSPAPTPQFKQLSQIKPLSFNPSSLSQSSRPVQYKTTISTLGMKPIGLSTLGRSSLLNPQKVDHPIKRMETMPFEVSILKGILGIGIKTTMTPEGYVQVSEILPSGPVGREGNIKVRDYILSINNTQLTGLPDSKVQQILRLLPRGLSKIVASAVIPDTSAEPVTPTVEKQKLSPRQSIPVSLSRQTTITTTPNPVILPSPKQPLTAIKSEPSSHQKPSSISVPPQASPRSPLASPRSPLPSPRSPMASPRQLDSPKSSPRTPPAVAPKPKRPPQQPSVPQPEIVERVSDIKKSIFDNKHKPQEEDPNKPIETEIFVSINGSKEDLIPSGPNILPGSVSYDSVQATEKTKWTPGKVSSADIKSQDLIGPKSGVISGKIDVVPDTSSPTETDTECKSTSPLPETLNDNAKPVKDSESISTDQAENQITNEEAFKSLDESISESQVDASLLLNRSRAFSTSSDISNSSYTEFNECNVEDELVPEQIAEEEEPELFSENANATKDTTQEDDNSNEYESDFEDLGNEETIQAEMTKDAMMEPETQSIDSGVNMEVLQNLAENIVSDVIANVKQMDLSAYETKEEDEDSAPENEAPPLPDEAPPLPTDAPPLEDFIDQTTEQAPPIPQSEAPPLPSMPVPVVDLTLYPDEIPESQIVEIIDVIDVSNTSQLHAEAPVINIVNPQNVDGVNIHELDSLSKQIKEDSKERGDDEATETKEIGKSCESDNIDGVEDGAGDQSINAVISMYSDIEKSLGPDTDINEHVKIVIPGETNLVIDVNKNKVIDGNVKINVNVDENENCDSKSLTSSEDFLSDTDIVEVVPEDKVETGVTVESSMTLIDSSVNAQVTSDIDTDSSKVNGHAVKEPETRTKPSHIDLSQNKMVGDKADSDQSPRSESTCSPRSVDAIIAEDEARRGKYSPEMDRMIRQMSQNQEPVNEGEGEIIHLKMTKGNSGLGFVIQGGKMSPRGDLPITIKRIFKSGPADGLLQAGDELCEVDGSDISAMRHSEAWNHLKFLPSGQLSITVRRYQQKESTE